MRYISKAKDVPGPYIPYLKLVPNDGRLTEHLWSIIGESVEMTAGLGNEALAFRYAAGKWTIKDIFQHLLDSERVYVYRAMRIARNDKTELPGFDENAYAITASASVRSITGILDEFALLRKATIAFVDTLDDESLDRVSKANNYMLSARLIVNQIYAHHRHHLNIIKERYLPALK